MKQLIITIVIIVIIIIIISYAVITATTVKFKELSLKFKNNVRNTSWSMVT